MVFLLLAGGARLWARSEPRICGTEPTTGIEERFLSARAEQTRIRKARFTGTAQRWARAPRADIGNLAILEDADGVVTRRNVFNLDRRTIIFRPSDATGAKYRFTLGDDTYDAAASDAGTPVALGDDDSKAVALPFTFRFFGVSNDRLFLNSDGNLTFGVGDSATASRSVGRLNSGPPRIAGLFADLDPTRVADGVRVLAESGRLVISWDRVPEYEDFGIGLRQRFQIRLYADGRIDLAYSGIAISEAVVGISPGGFRQSITLLSFVAGSADEYSGPVAELFTDGESLDLASAAQKFYLNHDDSYDVLVFYNGLGIPAKSGAVAFESTVRNNRSGFGDSLVDVGTQYGSLRRLQAVINMGPIDQYPVDTNAIVPLRQSPRDTPLTVIGHEFGHLFLAFVSVEDELGRRPMLGFQSAHWAFTFNSEASLVEGNRIRDNGPGGAPRFTTVGVTEGYAPLDQYLMGFRAPEEVPPTFYVSGAGSAFTNRQPAMNVGFDGSRVDVRVEDVISASGRRTPDHTVAQRRFRVAIVLVVRAGTDPTPAAVEQVDRYRREFEGFFLRASNERATADTTLKRAVSLSAWPAMGVVAGGSAPASITLEQAPQAPLTITLQPQSGNISTTPRTVTIPAGSSSAAFTITGVRIGTDDLTATPADDAYETTSARIQVGGGVTGLRFTLVSGDRQRSVAGLPLPAPVVFRVTDVNELPYPGLPVRLSVSGGGSATPASPTTDAAGLISLRWTPGSTGIQSLSVSLDSPAGPSAGATALPPRAFGNPVNAASFTAAVAPGAIATIFGAGMVEGLPATARSVPWPTTLGGARLLVNDQPAQLLYVGETQINFLIPPSIPVGTARLTLLVDGASFNLPSMTVAAASPGIFFDAATRYGAVLNAGTAENTFDRPAARGGVIEIYATGLGAVTSSGGLNPTVANPQVTIGGVSARVLFSGLAPGYEGLYQVNAEVPANAPTGAQPLIISMGPSQSNSVTVGIR
ncbi:MAG: hypothetical protein ACKV22_11050 [Bryobacteraceae bacterium]